MPANTSRPKSDVLSAANWAISSPSVPGLFRRTISPRTPPCKRGLHSQPPPVSVFNFYYYLFVLTRDTSYPRNTSLHRALNASRMTPLVYFLGIRMHLQEGSVVTPLESLWRIRTARMIPAGRTSPHQRQACVSPGHTSTPNGYTRFRMVQVPEAIRHRPYSHTLARIPHTRRHTLQ